MVKGLKIEQDGSSTLLLTLLLI